MSVTRGPIVAALAFAQLVLVVALAPTASAQTAPACCAASDLQCLIRLAPRKRPMPTQAAQTRRVVAAPQGPSVPSAALAGPTAGARAAVK